MSIMFSNDDTVAQARGRRETYAANCVICDGTIPRFLRARDWTEDVRIISETQEYRLPEGGKRYICHLQYHLEMLAASPLVKF